MKEKMRKIMYGGGYTLLIAFIATGAYLLVVHFANQYFESTKDEIKIEVSEDGTLSIDYNGDEKENIFVFWETDGGTLTPDTKSELLKDQYEEDNNRLYYANTVVTETVKWDNKDYTGSDFEKATVRAVIYLYDKDKNSNPYYMGDYITEVNITLEKDGEITKKSEDRYFSNPVMAGTDNNWNEIYVVREDEENVTLRYRTGNKIDDELLILCWQCEKSILSETDYVNGLYPDIKINEDNSNKSYFKAVNNITVSKENLKNNKIEAFLVTEDTYNNISDNKTEDSLKLFTDEITGN